MLFSTRSHWQAMAMLAFTTCNNSAILRQQHKTASRKVCAPLQCTSCQLRKGQPTVAVQHNQSALTNSGGTIQYFLPRSPGPQPRKTGRVLCWLLLGPRDLISYYSRKFWVQHTRVVAPPPTYFHREQACGQRCLWGRHSHPCGVRPYLYISVNC